MTRSARQARSCRFHHESPLSLCGSVPFAERKAYDHQIHNRNREVPLNDQHPDESPLSPGVSVPTREVPPTNRLPFSLSINNSSTTNNHSLLLSATCPKSCNPQPTYPSITTKHIVWANRKLQPSSEVFFIRCSPSQTPWSTKPIISLPKLNVPPRQAVVSSTHVPHFIIEYHSFLEKPPKSTFNTLSKIIQMKWRVMDLPVPLSWPIIIKQSKI
ncbi:hypothetical protein VP01_1447g1 [Puccinia sorghi]|uniref:Uncharacterized protein n=1 Tax=Puccinia sorghi TaxID=27349 RepID=A0A0L6VK40_9BASI|nr:hypothetical protein VP01_1447g1 [Puccinia sorghi]